MTIAANARERHPWLDPFMGAEGAPLRALIKTVTDSVEAQEQAIGARQRKRRPADQAHHEAALEAIISNLAYSILHPPKTGRLAILTGNAAIRRDRYSNPAMGKPVRMLLHRLSEIGVVAWDYGWRGNASTLAPTPEFAAMVRKAGIGLSDFGRQEGKNSFCFGGLARISQGENMSNPVPSWITLTPPKRMPSGPRWRPSTAILLLPLSSSLMMVESL